MRVISGKYGGRRLTSFKADLIRPTTDRVKETLFNKLQSEIEGSKVLDLFSGTGSLAVEALSRGAENVHAVEMNRKSVSIIEKNKELLNIGKELHIFPMDVLRFLKKNKESYDIVFIDPPFTKKMAHEVMEALATSGAFHKQSKIFIESSAQERMEDSYPSLALASRKDYGDKQLSEFVHCSL